MTMITITSDALGQRLKLSRLGAGLDQAGMASILGVARTTISSWERGISEPGVSQFITWAQVTKQPVDQLIDGLSGCTPWDLNPEPTDSESVSRAFWALVDALELEEVGL